MKRSVTVLCLFSICGATGMGLSPAAPAEETIKIGAVFAVTGGASFLGKPERNTALMIADEVNAQGGINGMKVEVIVEDTEGVATKTADAVKKLITRDNVIAIIGPSRSETSMTVKEMYEDQGYEVPVLSCGAAERIVNPVNKWIFKIPQKDSDAVKSIYALLKRRGQTKVAIITCQTGFGDQGREQLKNHAPEFGLRIVADEVYGPNDTDMTPQLTKISKTDAQALINWSIVAGQTIVMKNARQLGLKIPILQSHGYGNIKYTRAAGEAAEGVIFPCGRLLVAETMRPINCQKAPLLEYKRKYEEKYNDDVSTFGGHAYDALWLILHAVREVGLDRAKIRDYIETTKGFVGTGGVYYYSPEDHNGLNINAFEMIVVRDGKFYPLGE